MNEKFKQYMAIVKTKTWLNILSDGLILKDSFLFELKIKVHF